MPRPVRPLSQWSIIADLRRDVDRLRLRSPSQQVIFTHDTFTAAGTPSTTYPLTYLPTDGSVLLAKQGLVLREGTDYTVDGTTGIVTVTASQSSGDQIVFRYATTGELIANNATVENDNIVDTFNRADDASGLGTTSDGNGVWANVVGTWGILSNKAYPAAIPSITGAVAIADIDCQDSDGTVSVDVTFASNAQGIAARVLDRQNYIAVSTDGLYKVSPGSGPGTFTLLAALSLGSSTGTLSLVMSGSSLVVKWNGVTQASATSTWQQAQTRHGIGVFSSVTSARMDNWSFAP